MGKKRNTVAAKLEELGVDPVAALARIAAAAEGAQNLPLAARCYSDLLEYTAPKLKALELSLDDDTLDALVTREQRLNRIRELQLRLGMQQATEQSQQTRVIEHVPAG